jgi:hypothetical protein
VVQKAWPCFSDQRVTDKRIADKRFTANSLLLNVTINLVTDKSESQVADLNAAYMAFRPLAMCNQLTGCGKPERRANEVIDSESVSAQVAA